MELTIAQVHKLAEYVYYGLTVKEAFELSSLNFDELPTLTNIHGLLGVLKYAKLKAKFELMQAAHELATSKVSTVNSTRMLQHMVAARCGFTENGQELRLRQRQHEDLMKFRRENMRNWSDFQAAKMVASATGSQLMEFQQLEQKAD